MLYQLYESGNEFAAHPAGQRDERGAAERLEQWAAQAIGCATQPAVVRRRVMAPALNVMAPA
ncbi:hypothetical protein GCM10009804_45470 [Kribbella hippodromi]|uniref:Uncharacterized protein n=1 Tax=Kribbella hippodromi TaxID=434347 RepID=A0ABP4PP15_9ACTN